MLDLKVAILGILGIARGLHVGKPLALTRTKFSHAGDGFRHSLMSAATDTLGSTRRTAEEDDKLNWHKQVRKYRLTHC